MKIMRKVCVVVLAAGMGKRMQSDLPKTLIPIKGKPMLKHLAEAIIGAGVEDRVAVVNDTEVIKAKLGNDFKYVEQKERLDTAHALEAARELWEGSDAVITLYGDHPFIQSQTIKNLIEKIEATRATIVLGTVTLPDFSAWREVFWVFSRIFRKNSKITGSKEYKDLSEEEKKILEVNPGYYAFETRWLAENLKKVGNNNAAGEYYLADLLQFAFEQNKKVESIEIDAKEALGVNFKEHLEIMESLA